MPVFLYENYENNFLKIIVKNCMKYFIINSYFKENETYDRWMR